MLRTAVYREASMLHRFAHDPVGQHCNAALSGDCGKTMRPGINMPEPLI